MSYESREEARPLLRTREQRDEALERLRAWCMAIADWAREHEYHGAEQRFVGYALAVGALRNPTGENLVRLAETIETARYDFFDSRFGPVAVRDRQALELRRQVGYDTCRATDLPAEPGPYVCGECGCDAAPLRRGFILMCARCAGFNLIWKGKDDVR
jgi:hypothetical protein